MKLLLGKELLELLRTRRWLVLPILFVVFGIGGPALVRLLPILLKTAGAGLEITLPPPVPADGFAQFLQSANQMGLLAVILTSMGLVASERRGGTLATLLVRPVSRQSFLWAKWLVNGVYALLSFIVGAGFAILYSYLLLGTPDTASLLLATALFLPYLLLTFSWTLFFSTAAGGPAAAGGLSLIPLFLLPILGSICKPLGEYGPYGVVPAATKLVGGMGTPSLPVEPAALVSVAVNLSLSALLVLGAWLVLRRAEL
ncbi:MAG: putative transmembrane protein YxlG [Actinobacteria bacterium ADurb.Bin444]|nr:MAG: putative transmembrane protein YxlG [Actinobacteria bacterium ADurb.Bin444]